MGGEKLLGGHVLEELGQWMKEDTPVRVRVGDEWFRGRLRGCYDWGLKIEKDGGKILFAAADSVEAIEQAEKIETWDDLPRFKAD